MFDLTNRVAVITGASSGLGVQFAHALVNQGASVALLARRKDKLEAVAAELQKGEKRALPVVCDVTNPASVQKAVAKVMSEFGRVDILVNNAGCASRAQAENLSDEEWARVVNLNLTAVFTCCREFGNQMLKVGYGRIINIASMYGLVGSNFSPNVSYHASKGAVVNFTRSLAAEWAKRGITVNVICPGFFNTELTSEFIDDKSFLNTLDKYCPMARAGHSGELDTSLIYLASNETSYTTGCILTVDGGWTAI